VHPTVAEGIRLFNAQKFFEAHEALERLWLKQRGEEKLLLHGLIQVAAAFHHYQGGNWEGFRRVLAKGASKLSQLQRTRHGIDVREFRRQIALWLAASSPGDLAASSAALPFPQIRITRGRGARREVDQI